MKKYAYFYLILLSIPSCTNVPKNAEQTVFALESSYAATLTIAVKYKALPSCDLPVAPTLCAKPSVIKQLQMADEVAYPAIKATQALVRNSNGSGQDVAQAISLAQKSLDALIVLTTNLGVQ